VHVDEALRPGAFVQIVDILGDDQKLARPIFVEPRQRRMSRVGFRTREPRAPRIIESVNKVRIASESLRRAYILYAVPLPKPVRPAKGCKPALRRNSGAGENDDASNFVHAFS
jgi:hypothetical protein